jgi:hypothetical protein
MPVSRYTGGGRGEGRERGRGRQRWGEKVVGREKGKGGTVMVVVGGEKPVSASTCGRGAPSGGREAGR